MEKTKTIIVSILVVILVFLICGLIIGLYEEGVLTGRAPQNQESIKVGAILPLSGNAAYLGEYIKEGLELARGDINSQGGIDGRKLEIIYEDSQAETQLGITAYQKLVSVDGVNILFTSLSHITLGIAPLAEQERVLVFSVANAAPRISEAGDYVFRHNLLPQTEAKYLADLIFNRLGYKEIAMMVVNTESGVSYRDELVRDYEDLGGRIVLIEMHDRGTKDFRTQLTKIKSTGVEAVILGSYAQEDGFIVKQAQELELDVQWFSIYAVETPKFLEIAGDSANGVIYTHFYDLGMPSLQEYQVKYQDSYGKTSDAYAALAYDSVLILADAMKNCEDPEDSTCIKNQLYRIRNFPGVTGSISFDANGDTHKEIIVKIVRDGEFVAYEA